MTLYGRKPATHPCVSSSSHKENRRYTHQSGVKAQIGSHRAFRSVTGSSAACGELLRLFSIPIVLPQGHNLRSGLPVKQDDRNAAFCAARLSDLLHRSYPPAAAISGFIAACTTTYRHSTPFQALYHHISLRQDCQGFFAGFFRKFAIFSGNFSKQMFAFFELLCYYKNNHTMQRCFS